MKPTPGQPTWRTRLLITLIGWAIAFVIVYLLLAVFGKQLESLPIALNALIFTGILVPIMGNLVMPHVSALVMRRSQEKPRKKSV